MKRDQWKIEDVYKIVDKDNKGWIGIFDVERLLTTHTKAGQRASLISDIELLIGAFDRSG